MFNSKIVKAFPRDQDYRKMPTITLSLILIVEVIVSAIKQEKEIKSIQIGKEEMKLSLFVDDMAVHTENPKEPTIQLLELIREFSKVTEFNVGLL